METTFDKPVGTELNQLNSNLTTLANRFAGGGETFGFQFSTYGFDNTFDLAGFNTVNIIRVSAQLSNPFTSNNFIGLQWKNGNGNYGTQFVFGFGGDHVAVRTKNAGTWGSWVAIH